jgi:ATP-binding cassette subfamily E protein 1
VCSSDLGDFTLEAEAGTVYAGEVVGIVGPNGIGKTTFVKMLAGALEPDKGEVELKVTVSYKPQYLTSDYEGTVESLFNERIRESMVESFFEREVLHPMGLKRLMEQHVSTLSGGELQRVAVALCLGANADLYLLDEPSAYMDSNQRITSAKVIRRTMESRGKTALVVDHDVYFIDMIGDRIMVFDGEPAKHGVAKGPFSMRDGMNVFLSKLDITFRRDADSKRPRINKPDSVQDRDQHEKGEYYYDV